MPFQPGDLSLEEALNLQKVLTYAQAQHSGRFLLEEVSDITDLAPEVVRTILDSEVAKFFIENKRICYQMKSEEARGACTTCTEVLKTLLGQEKISVADRTSYINAYIKNLRQKPEL